jgi:hypothetical protein
VRFRFLSHQYPCVRICSAGILILDDLWDSMHTAQDTIDRPEYSLEHVREFVRIGLGYVVELAGRFDSLNRDGDF